MAIKKNTKQIVKSYYEIINILALDFLCSYDFSNLGDNPEKEKERRQQIKSIRKNYKSKVVPLQDNPEYGFVQVDYTRNGGGRMYSDGISLQSMKKDLRKFLLEGFCWNCKKDCQCSDTSFARDIDMVNAHPTILLYLLKKYNIDKNLYKLLEYQVNNRDKCMKHYGIDKKDFVAFLNCEKTFIDAPWTNPEFILLNQAIYGTNGLLAVVEKDKEHKEFIKQVKKELKLSDNSDGKLFARFIQRQENEILQLIIQQLTNEGIQVRSLQFDGVIVDNDPKLNQSFLDTLMKRINDARQYGIKLTMKNLNSTWQPECSPLGTWDAEEECETLKETNKYLRDKAKQLLNDAITVSKDGEILKDKKKYKLFIDYMNDYMAIINEPHGYVYKKDISKKWMNGNSSILREVFGIKVFDEWNSSDDKREFDRIDFYVNLETNDIPKNENILNTFIRPKWDNSKIHSIDDFPNFKEYLFNVVSNEDKSVFEWFLDYLGTLWQNGKTGMIIVLMGERGDGKSIMYEQVIHHMLGSDGKYWMETNNPSDLNANFTSLQEGCFVIGLEEMVNVGDKGNGIKVQEALKSLSQKPYLIIQHRYQHPYKIDNNLNFIITTNFNFPVKIFPDNRRYVNIRTSNCWNGNEKKFNALFEELETKAEQFRGFLSQRQIPKRMKVINTKENEELIEMSKSSWKAWVDDRLDQFFNDTTSNSSKRICSDLFMKDYKTFHTSNEFKGDTLRVGVLMPEFNRYSTKYKISRPSLPDGSRPYVLELKENK